MPPQSRMELEITEAEYKRNLEKAEKLGRKKGMADAYGKLGTVYITLGHLDKAEDMFKKSLQLFAATGAGQMVELLQEMLANLKKRKVS